MLPRSPPLPFTHKIFTVWPVRGSTSSILELVLPPAKLVMRRSEPSRFERYRSKSGSSSLSATAGSQRSSRNFKETVEAAATDMFSPTGESVGLTLSYRKSNREPVSVRDLTDDGAKNRVL